MDIKKTIEESKKNKLLKENPQVKTGVEVVVEEKIKPELSRIDENVSSVKESVAKVDKNITKVSENIGELKEEINEMTDPSQLATLFFNKFKGEQGYTPEKGKDYFTEEEVQEIVERIEALIPPMIPEPLKGEAGQDAITPIKGKDYFTKEEIKQFKTSITPLKGVDYVDGKDAVVDYRLIVKEAIKQIPPAVDGRTPKHEIEGLKIRFENPDGTMGNWIDFNFITRLLKHSQGGGGVGTIKDAGTVVKTGASEINFGDNLTVTVTEHGVTVDADAGGAGGHIIQEEGVNLTARTNLNFVGTGITATDDAGNDQTDVTLDATLNSIAALGTAADKIAYTTAVDTWAETSITAFGRSLIDDAAAVNGRSTLGLVIGTDVQAWSSNLDEYSAVNPTAAGLALLDDADATAQLVTLGFTSTITELNYTDGVTSAIQTQLDGKVDESLFDAHTVIYATADNTPLALTVGEQTLVGRVSGGNIAAIAIDADLSAVSASDDTIPSAKATKAYADTKQTSDATLTALASYNTNGLLTQTAADTFTGRTVTGTANQISVSNGDGVAGNPTLSLPADVIIPTVITAPNTGLHILDTNASHDLIIAAGSDLTADHTLTLTTGDADRTVTLSGNPTLSDWFDQSVKTTANPTFGNLTITSFAANWTNAGRTVADLGTVTTADINGGTLDGTVIGGASAAAGTFTTIAGTTLSLTDLATITKAGNLLTLTNSTDANSVQVAILQGDRATMADNDEAYASLKLSNDGGTQTEVARITWAIPDVNVATSEDGRLDFSVMTGGVLAKELQLSGADLAPSSNDGLSLGTLSLSFSDLFLASGAVVNIANDWIATHSAAVLTVGTGDLRVTTAGTNAASVVTVGGTQTLTAKTLTSPVIGTSPTAAGSTWTDLGTVTTADINGGTLDAVVIGGASAAAATVTTLVVNTSALPDADDGAPLGASGTAWSDLFLASGAVINFAAGDATITHAAGGLDVLLAGTDTFNIKGNATQAGELRLYEDTTDGTNFTAFKVGIQAGDITYTLPTTDGDASQFLQTDGSGVLTWATGGGGGGSAMTFTVAQVAHGLSVGNAIKVTGANTYAKAQADSAANAEVVGYVTVVTDVDNFTIALPGSKVTTGVPAVAAGTVLFLSPSSAGALTSTEPSTTGQVSKPVAVVTENATSMIFIDYRGQLITAPVGKADTVTSVAIDTTLTTAEVGVTYTNTATVNFTLPTLTTGIWFRFVVGSANYLKITAVGGSTIRYLADVTAANGYARSTTQGHQLRVLGMASGWVVTDLDGTFTFDS